MAITREAVLAALGTVPMPGAGGSIVDADIVRALTIEADRVRFLLEVDPAQGAALEPMRAAAEAAVAALPGVAAVSALLTAHGPAAEGAATRPQDRPPPDAAGRPGHGARGQAHHRHRLRQGRRRQVDRRRQPRGGARAGGQAHRAPRRRHLRPVPAADDGRQRAPRSPDGKTILPLHAHGVTMMSIGLMLKEGEAVIWRGPMLHGRAAAADGPGRLGRARRADRRPAARHRRRPAHPQPEVHDHRRDPRLDAAGRGAARRAQGARHVRQDPACRSSASSRTCRATSAPTAATRRTSSATAAPAPRPSASACPSSARSPSTSAIRLAGDDGTPIVAANPDSPEARAFRGVARRLIAGGIV